MDATSWPVYAPPPASIPIRDLAAEARAGKLLPVDVDNCAARLEVAVLSRQLPPTLWGATLPSRKVVLNAGLPSRRRRFALAHELGHVLVQDGRAPWVIGDGEELFCDRFARELLAPIEHLAPNTPADVLAATFDVELGVVLSQMAIGRLGTKAVTVLGDLVICARCGDIERNPPCQCSPYRVRG